jgi:hypothetical protein
MSQDDEQVIADAADQHGGEGDDLDNKDDTDTGSDDGQDTGDGEGRGNDKAGDEGGFKTKFEDQQKRANNAERLLKAAGLDPKTGKPKESRAPNKDGKNALSDEDNARIDRAEERAERAELRSVGVTHPDDIAFVRKQAKHFDGDVVAAADDEFVKNKLARMKATRDTKDATPQPNRRSGASRSTKLPDFSKMSNTEFDKWERENRA